MGNVYSVLKEIFPSEEMASFLAKCSLTQEEIADAIEGAAISLERKRELFLLLAEEEKSSFFSSKADIIFQVIQEMQPKPGEFFYLKSYFYEDSGLPEEKALQPFLTWEHIFEYIREFMEYQEAGEDTMVWFCVEKWAPDGTGRLKNDYDYTVVVGEVSYFSCNDPSLWEHIAFAESRNLNLPVPFHAGDIVTVDCRPFAPVKHVVILEVGDNRDCCCLQALFRKTDGTWGTGAVKHGHMFPNVYSPELSPLYRLASFQGQLPEEERLLEKVSRYVNGDEARGAALWDDISCHRDGKWENGMDEGGWIEYLHNE